MADLENSPTWARGFTAYFPPQMKAAAYLDGQIDGKRWASASP